MSQPSTPPVKAVVFDIDGTLIDSVDLHAKAWADVFAEYGHDIDAGQVRDQIGKGGDKLLPVFLSEAEIAERGEEIEARRGEILKGRYIPQIRPFPAVRELFERLIASGLKVALASSAKGDELQTYKGIAGIDDLPLVETSSDDAKESKPAPDIFEAAMKRLPGIEPAEAIAIGDTPYDAQAAGKAGLRTVGMLCGGWKAEALRQAGCCAVFDDPAHLLRDLDKLLAV